MPGTNKRRALTKDDEPEPSGGQSGSSSHAKNLERTIEGVQEPDEDET